MALITMDVYLDGKDAPVEVHVISADLMVYDDINVKGRNSQAAMMLTCAYITIEGKEPKSLNEVKTWGREHQVACMVKNDMPSPTQSTATPDF